jgi:hypothetical protein
MRLAWNKGKKDRGGKIAYESEIKVIIAMDLRERVNWKRRC